MHVQQYTAPNITVLAALSKGFYLPGPHYVHVEGEGGVLPGGLSPPVAYDSVPNFSGRGYAILDYGHSDNVSLKFSVCMYAVPSCAVIRVHYQYCTILLRVKYHML